MTVFGDDYRLTHCWNVVDLLHLSVSCWLGAGHVTLYGLWIRSNCPRCDKLLRSDIACNTCFVIHMLFVVTSYYDDDDAWWTGTSLTGASCAVSIPTTLWRHHVWRHCLRCLGQLCLREVSKRTTQLACRHKPRSAKEVLWLLTSSEKYRASSNPCMHQKITVVWQLLAKAYRLVASWNRSVSRAVATVVSA